MITLHSDTELARRELKGSKHAVDINHMKISAHFLENDP